MNAGKSSRYGTDFAAWAEEQAALLRAHAGERLDWDNLAEEIEDLAGSERHALKNRIKRICRHLLKWQHQPEYQSGSGRARITTQRREAEELLNDSPSLRGYADAILASAYAQGRETAEIETGLLHLPQQCPWLLDQVLDPSYWP
jgi:hypothetical protein